MKIKVTSDIANFFFEKKIFFDYRPSHAKLKEGDEVWFQDDALIEPYVGIYGSGKNLVEMGAFSYTNSALPIGVKVGRYCSIAWNLRFLGPRHPLEYISSSHFTYDKNTTDVYSAIQDFDSSYANFFPAPQKKMPQIANDVWIGQDVTLNNGISIGTGSVIAANSVVTRSVGEYEIWGGNPAKLIKKRFDDDIVVLLSESKWWLYKFTDFKDLDITNPITFCEQFSNRKSSIEVFSPLKIAITDVPMTF